MFHIMLQQFSRPTSQPSARGAPDDSYPYARIGSCFPCTTVMQLLCSATAPAYVCPAHGLYCRRYMVWVVQPRRCLASPSPSATSVHGPPRHMGSIRLVAHHTATAEKAAERVQPQRIALFWYGQTLSFDVFLQPHDLESDFWAQHALHAPQAV